MRFPFTHAMVRRLFALSSMVPLITAATTVNAQTLQQTGRWGLNGESYEVKVQGVHMAVLPSLPPQQWSYTFGESTKVLQYWFKALPYTDAGAKLWTFVPSAALSVPVPSGVGVNMAAVDRPPPTNANGIFCGTHTSMPEGQLLAVGGEYGGVDGLDSAFVFDQRVQPSGSGLHPYSQQWSAVEPMRYGRWYGTAMTLSDGSIASFSGLWHTPYVTFGGRTTSGARSNGVNMLAVWRSLEWPAIDIASGPGTQDCYGWQAGFPTSPDPPEGRDGAAMAFLPSFAYLMFGGETDAGVTNDAWYLTYLDNPTSDAEPNPKWKWCHLCYQENTPIPNARTRHTMVRDSSDIIVFGGRGQNGEALDDVWRLYQVHTGSRPGCYRWEQLTVSGTAPPARYAHSMVADPARWSGDRRRILIYGGTANGTSAVDAAGKVWSLRRTDTGWEWEDLVIDNALLPPSRWDHAAVLDQNLRTVGGQVVMRNIVIGGRVAGGFVDDAQALTLTRQQYGSAPQTPSAWKWQWLPLPPPLSAGADRCWPRARHVLMHHLTTGGQDYLVLVGGETPSAAGTTDAFRYDLNMAHHVSLQGWLLSPATGGPSARTGAAALRWPGAFAARTPETFDLAANNGGLPGQWTEHASAALFPFSPGYPMLFELSDGKLFFAGPHNRPHRYLLDRSNWTWSGSLNSNYFSGASVMYLPDKIMRCGAQSPGDAFKVNETGDGVGTTETFVYPTSTQWQTESEMQPRANHNLTLLPTGQVLVTGGLDMQGDPAVRVSVPGPQIWTPAVGATPASWTAYGQLASEPVARNYHSSALLLPDGRVLSAGGNPLQTTPGQGSESHDHYSKLTIFEPPYLFSGNSYAVRPEINYVSSTLAYNSEFGICVCNVGTDPSVWKVCLVRPGSATHGINADQRFVPLSFTLQANGHGITATMPNDANITPPGFYYLFVLKSGVPSVARWVRVGPSAAGGTLPDCSGNCGGGGGGGCPIAETFTDHGWVEENTVLGRSLDGALATDYLKLTAVPRIEGDRVQVRLREGGREYTHLDRATLLAVDHAPGMEPFERNGKIMLGIRLPAYRVVTAAGSDVTALVNGSGKEYVGEQGDILYVEMFPPNADHSHDPRFGLKAPKSPVVLEVIEKEVYSPGDQQPLAADDRTTLEETGVVVQVPDDAGGWVTLQRIYPRREVSARLVASEGPNIFRLVFMGHHRVGFLGTLGHSGMRPKVTELGLASATHSKSGSVVTEVAAEDPLTTWLRPGEAITLDFKAPDVAPAAATGAACGTDPGSCCCAPGPCICGLGEQQVRDWFLVLRGVYTSSPPEAVSLPARFALAQNRPNPFGSKTVISFDLPARAPVVVEIFDLQGRLVQTLARREFEAGRWSIEWDRRDANGKLARQGIYLYRVRAGADQEQKKMIVLP